jgi:hypothetical protein
MKDKRNDPHYREKENSHCSQYMKDKRNDPHYREKENSHCSQYMKDKRNDPHYSEKEKSHCSQYMKDKRNDPHYRSQEKVATVKRQRATRSCVQKKQEENERNCLRMEQKRLDRQQKTAEKKADRLRKQQCRLNEIYKFREDLITEYRQKSKDPEYRRRLQFIADIRQVPDKICCCCEGLWFARSVLKLNLSIMRDAYNKNKSTKDDIIYDPEEFRQMVVGYNSDYICYTCNNNFRAGKVPLINPNCGLKFPYVEPEIRELNDLEERLLSPHPKKKFNYFLGNLFLP